MAENVKKVRLRAPCGKVVFIVLDIISKTALTTPFNTIYLQVFWLNFFNISVFEWTERCRDIVSFLSVQKYFFNVKLETHRAWLHFRLFLNSFFRLQVSIGLPHIIFNKTKIFVEHMSSYWTALLILWQNSIRHNIISRLHHSPTLTISKLKSVKTSLHFIVCMTICKYLAEGGCFFY